MKNSSVKKTDKDLEKVGIFYKNWIETALLAAGLPNCAHKSWRIGQVVYGVEDVERLVSLNAPIKVYIEDVDGTAES